MRTFPKVRNTAVSSIRNKIIIPFFIYHLRTPLLMGYTDSITVSLSRDITSILTSREANELHVFLTICYIYKYSSYNQQWWTEWKIVY
jgi:hypothetical protein